MTFEDYCRQLRETGCYRTPDPLRRGLGDRLFGWSDLWYHARLMRVIFSASRYARQGRLDRDAWRRHSFAITRLVECCGARIEVTGLDNLLRLNGPAVCVSNHMSILDTFVLPALLIENQMATFVVKQSLMTYPVFGAIMRAVGPIAVGRANPREDLKTVMEEGVRRLQEGRVVMIFPQATRAPAFIPAQFNTLGLKLAQRAGVPLIPVALKTDFVQNGKWLKDFGRLDRRRQAVHVAFGAPLACDKGAGRDVHEKVIRHIATHLRAWGGEVREAAPQAAPEGSAPAPV